VGVPLRLPGSGGNKGWVRSRAWTWDFSSTHRTIARSGGLKYRPTTSRTFSTNKGSVDSEGLSNCNEHLGWDEVSALGVVLNTCAHSSLAGRTKSDYAIVSSNIPRRPWESGPPWQARLPGACKRNSRTT
jgi:hypothetical protein